ncbi:MAG: hypothetical protein HXX10_00585 [Rhodoplanes sp.]|uniref:hypothetical protein n=1 Tax=Rhodoplanes sp. TaxID=1968906 RepID=UPI0017AE892A|nr:hypothetical protein [Rhodoplanes sp.]NVO12512.1 hypothetical protein [Rhodoplanes sp.]
MTWSRPTTSAIARRTTARTRPSSWRRTIRALLLVSVVALFGTTWPGGADAADIAPRGYAGYAGEVAGPIIGGTVANNGYYAYGPYAGPGAPLPWSNLYGPAVPVAPGCFMQRQRIWTEYGWRWRVAPLCY